MNSLGLVYYPKTAGPEDSGVREPLCLRRPLAQRKRCCSPDWGPSGDRGHRRAELSREKVMRGVIGERLGRESVDFTGNESTRGFGTSGLCDPRGRQSV